MTTPIQPLPPQRRHAADYRDGIEHAEVAQIVSELPADHPVRAAYLSGAREAADSIGLSRLLADRMDLVQRLVAAYTAHADRIWSRCGGGFRVR